MTVRICILALLLATIIAMFVRHPPAIFSDDTTPVAVDELIRMNPE